MTKQTGEVFRNVREIAGKIRGHIRLTLRSETLPFRHCILSVFVLCPLLWKECLCNSMTKANAFQSFHPTLPQAFPKPAKAVRFLNLRRIL